MTATTRPITSAQWRRCVPPLLSAAAGVIHLAIAPEHFRESLNIGLFMVGAGLAQLVVAVLLWRRPSRRVTALTITGTVAMLVVYLLSRATGLPLGPEPWMPEDVHAIDLVCKASELGLLLTLVVGWHRWPRSATGDGRTLSVSQ